MARVIARAYVKRLPRHVLAGDIEQAALVGLWDGLCRNPDGSGPGHDWYLRCRIRGEIGDELRRQDWAARRRNKGTPAVVVHLEDVSECWDDVMPGWSESPELAAITRLDADKAWQAPINPIDRRVLRARYLGERKQDDVADDEGLSAARICQRESRGLSGMRCHLTGTPPAERVLPPRRVALWKTAGQ